MMRMGLTETQMQDRERQRVTLLAPYVQMVLERARDLLADKRNWTPGAMARNGRGAPTSALSPFAQRYCGMGAIEVSAHRLSLEMELPTPESQTSFTAHELYMAAVEVAQPAVVNAAAAITGQTFDTHTDIPRVNDAVQNGGYEAVMAGLTFAAANGGSVSSEVTSAVTSYLREHQADARTRALASRRARRERLQAEREQAIREEIMAEAAMQVAEENPEIEAIVFGGTLPSTTPVASPVGMEVKF